MIPSSNISIRLPGFKLSLLLVFIASLASCVDSGWGGKKYVKKGLDVIENPENGIWPTDRIRLTQDLVLGDEDDPHQLFFKIRGVEVSSDGRIHVLDSGNQRIAVFNENGVFLFEYGRAGAGPGEFVEPNGMSLDSAGSVYVLDRQLRRVTKFNSQGEYLLASPIQTYIHYIEVLSEDMVLLSGMIFGRFGAFGGLYDLASQAYRFHLELPFPTEVEFPGRVSVSLEERYQVLSDGYIYLAVPYPYEIRKYSREGQLLTKILKKDSRVQAPIIERMGNGISIRDRGHAGPCFLTPQGLLINNCEWKSEEAGHVGFRTGLDFFDGDGKYLTTVNLPNRRKLSAVDNKGRLYLLESQPIEKVIRFILEVTE